MKVELSENEATTRARAALNLLDTVPGHAWHVRRLDREDDAYYLVVFGELDAAIAVVAVGAERGEVRTSARLPGRLPHLTIDAAQARARTNMGSDAQAELVWMPSRASRSPLYPLWEIQSGGRVVYVDHQGVTWVDLSEVGQGG